MLQKTHKYTQPLVRICGLDQVSYLLRPVFPAMDKQVYQFLLVLNVVESMKLELLSLASLHFYLKCREDGVQTSFAESDHQNLHICIMFLSKKLEYTAW